MRRLLEDPQLALALRHDLLRSHAAAQDYDNCAKILQLRAALATYDSELRRSDVAQQAAWRASTLLAHSPDSPMRGAVLGAIATRRR